MHDDATIALLGSGAPHDFKVLSLDPPFVLGKPVHYVPAHVDVEADVSSVAGFIQDTNLVVLVGHGLTALGRNVSEAYHRLNTFTAEVRRCLLAEQVAALKGTTPAYRAQHEIEEMYRFAERIIYPTRRRPRDARGSGGVGRWRRRPVPASRRASLRCLLVTCLLFVITVAKRSPIRAAAMLPATRCRTPMRRCRRARFGSRSPCCW